MKRKKLVIISHTEHYKNTENQIVGWGSTINEINFLADYWEEVVHVGCFYNDKAPSSALPYSKNNIRFKAIPPYGGKTLFDKIKIFTKIPKIVAVVYKNLKDATEVQLRLPTSMGLFLLPLFSFIFPRKYTFWVKYAGNWAQETPPLSYRMQRWWLKNDFAKCKVTINGFWENQPKHCLSFENPCLTERQIADGDIQMQRKDFVKPFVFTFIGRLEEEKGVKRIISALEKLPEELIKEVHFIGDGIKKNEFKDSASFLREKALFHGFQSTKTVHEILKKSHFFLLPSTASEGFPKVIAEAACYGVIPIVSNVSSIPHYINNKNGFLWKINEPKVFDEILFDSVTYDKKELIVRSKGVVELANKFTFKNYLNKLETKIFNE